MLSGLIQIISKPLQQQKDIVVPQEVKTFQNMMLGVPMSEINWWLYC